MSAGWDLSTKMKYLPPVDIASEGRGHALLVTDNDSTVHLHDASDQHLKSLCH